MVSVAVAFVFVLVILCVGGFTPSVNEDRWPRWEIAPTVLDDATVVLPLAELFVAEAAGAKGSSNGGAFPSGCGLLAPAPAKVPLVLPFPPEPE